MYQTFKDLYLKAKSKPTPVSQFIKEVAFVTGRSESTVKKWVIGIQTPNKESRLKLAEYFKITEEFLFPETKNDCDEKQ